MNKDIISLDDIKIFRNKNLEYNNKETHKNGLNMSISTWMKLYANLETSEYRASMRDVCISIAEALREGKAVVKKHGTFSSKFTSSAPYHFFFSVVTEVEDTYNRINSVTFHEIIDYALGEIVESIHLTSVVELSWIITEYMLAAQNPKMTIICHDCIDSEIQYDLPFDFDYIEIQLPVSSNHHSKISILKFRDNKIRIIVSTANMNNTDWKFYSQGLWVSPLLPILPENANPSDGESVTNFKNDFIRYLNAYNMPEVFGWEALLQRTDCSAINVFFIGSIPGLHSDSNLDTWGHTKLGTILSNHITISPDSKNWPVIAQSSIENLGDNYHSWLQSNIVYSMSREKHKEIIFLPDIKLIYPSEDNFNNSNGTKSHQNRMYYTETHLKQQWIKNYLYQWKSEKECLTLAVPHTKTYTRLSSDETEIPWFLLTSCNLTSAAWGRLTVSKHKCLKIKNYEAGVLFIPEFIIKQKTFPVKESNSPEIPVFLLPYDVPLVPYKPDDDPFLKKKNDNTR